jgi:hypothetical protein
MESSLVSSNNIGTSSVQSNSTCDNVSCVQQWIWLNHQNNSFNATLLQQNESLTLTFSSTTRCWIHSDSGLTSNTNVIIIVDNTDDVEAQMESYKNKRNFNLVCYVSIGTGCFIMCILVFIVHVENKTSEYFQLLKNARQYLRNSTKLGRLVRSQLDQRRDESYRSLHTLLMEQTTLSTVVVELMLSYLMTVVDFGVMDNNTGILRSVGITVGQQVSILESSTPPSFTQARVLEHDASSDLYLVQQVLCHQQHIVHPSDICLF